MARVKKVLLGLLLALIFAAGAVVGVVLWIVAYPGDAWRLTERHLLPKDLKITWERIEFTGSRRGWSEGRVQWAIHGAKIVKGKPSVDMLFEKAAIDFDAHLFNPAEWFHIHGAEVIGSKPMRVALEPSQESSAPRSLYQTVRGALDMLAKAEGLILVDRLRVDLPELAIRPAGAKEDLLLRLFLMKPAEKDEKSVNVDVSVKSSDLNASLKGLFTGERLRGEDVFFAGDLWVKTPTVEAALPLAPRLNGERLEMSAKAALKIKVGGKTLAAEPDFKFGLAPEQGDLKIKSDVRDLPGPLVRLSNVQADITWPMENDVNWSPKPLNYRIWGPVDLFFIDKNMRPPLEKSCRCSIPERLGVEIAGQAWLDKLIENPPERHHAATAVLKVESVSNKLFRSDLAAALALDREKGQWLLDPNIDAKVIIHSYQGVRQFLDAKNVLIPAPLDVLDGTVTLTAKGPVTRETERARTTVAVDFDLRSPSQRVSLKTETILDLNEKLTDLDVFVKARIERLQLELPPLDPVRGVPSFTKDARVKLKPEAPAAKRSKFRLRIFTDLETAEDGAIRLLSGLAKPYVPITLKINTGATAAVDGFLRLEPFSVTYLRRTVKNEKFQIQLTDVEDGDQSNYKIFVNVSGTIRNPHIDLDSDPYLPRSEIISVLLYDRTSDQLVSADAETVGGFEAALADRAIGLLGLWALSTTPIRSFSYNAVTKVYSATVQLSDGLTAGVGTNWEHAAHLELRKRVSRRWVLTASWSPSSENEQVGKLVLQWEKRF